MPSKGKRPGNQHNSRHENGVVAPGKRVVRRKSDGPLNGAQPNGSAEAGFANTGIQRTTPSSAVRTTAQTSDRRASGLIVTKREDSQAEDESKVSAPKECVRKDDVPNPAAEINGSIEHGQRKTEVKHKRGSMSNPSEVLNLALTILRSCPVGDTLTILIVLLSLPTALLTIINALFAVLTFMPPAGSFSSLPNTFNDIFRGSGGTPSLATILFTDLIGLLVWMAASSPFQNLATELTQAVVATTLGGGSTSKKSGSDSTIFCMGIVTINHVARHGWIPERILGFDWPAILSSIPYVPQSPSSFIPDEGQTVTRSPAGWFRVLVALHILIQGLVHLARRWYQKREYFQSAASIKKIDPEAVAGSPIRPNTALSEVSGQNHAIPVGDMKVATALSKDAREKVSTGKKRRKQGTYVRSQQPLWAAFAATKVTVLREYEQTHSQSQSAASNAQDTTSLGSAPFPAEDDRIWISEVHPDRFVFHTSSFSTSGLEKDAFESFVSAGIDRTKPLFVRVNDTNWTSTKLERRTSSESADQLWTGEVFGLSPSSSYRCSFVQSEGGTVVYSMIVTTPPSLVPESEPSASNPDVPHRGHRPSSPTSPMTTLRKSILTFENNVAESQARQKRSKKESKSVSAALKKDIDGFSAKIIKLGNDEKGHQTRHLQWNQHTRQAEEAIAASTSEIESLGCIPEDELHMAKEKKAEWDRIRRDQTIARESLFQGKEAALRERSSVQGEATSLQQKRERLLARRTKQNDQYERLETATTQELNDKERRTSERVAKDTEHAQYNCWANEEMARCYNASQEARHIAQNNWSQIQVIASAFDEQRSRSGGNPMVRPLTPEGDLPGENPNSSATPAFRFPAFGTPDSSNGLRSHSNSIRHNGARPRSTSMRSGNSHYTDFEDQDPAPPIPTRAVEMIRGGGRKRSGGSGGGSSGSNSQRDPTSPIGGKDSPVGKRSPIGFQ